MSATRKAVLLSLLLSAGVIVGALVSTPYFRRAFSVGHTSELFSALAAIALAVPLCSWPWFSALRASEEPTRSPGVLLFSALSFAAALAFSPAIREAPAEGVGYYVILYVIATWVAGPLLLKIRSAEREQSEP